MAAIIILRFILFNRKGDYIFFLIGIVLGGGNDLISMYKHVYAYLPKDFSTLPLPLWMIFFWGEIFIFFRKLMRFGPFLGTKLEINNLIDLPLLFDFVVLITYRIIIYHFAARYWVPDALYASILVLRLVAWPPLRNERRLMLAMLILGPAYEIGLIKSGLYVYQTPVFFGMPLWLIIYWVFVVRFLKAIFNHVEFYYAGGAQ